MTQSLRIALAQISARIGDVVHNAAQARKARDEAARQGADLVLFPELHICGYPPEDLVLRPAFQAECHSTVEQLARETAQGPALLLGTPWVENGQLYNAVAYLRAGKIEAVRFKHDLPNYGVFDEKRVFAPGPLPSPLVINGVTFGLPICEDIWQGDVVTEKFLVEGAEFLLVPNGSPFSAEKAKARRATVQARVEKTKLPLLYLNRVGGQDELVFDGDSFGLHADGSVAFQFPAFEEKLAVLTWTKNGQTWRCDTEMQARMPEPLERLYEACCMGLRDYVRGNDFEDVLLGLSGGIDSALVACICADALGAEHVRAYMLPSRYTSQHSIEDAQACAKNLGIHHEVISIEPALIAALATLQNPQGIAQENLQSRLRGTLLMALSNNSGAMLISTGNKSEMAVGYATLYGDMNGGFNPIKDLYKTKVYELAHWRNSRSEVIPARIISKAPSAELRANQTDQDSLPSYDSLDAILEQMIEHDMPAYDIIRTGHDRETVLRIENMVALAEYKRRQSPPGVKLSSRYFGRDRRYPITNGFRDSGKPAGPETATPHYEKEDF